MRHTRWMGGAAKWVALRVLLSVGVTLGVAWAAAFSSAARAQSVASLTPDTRETLAWVLASRDHGAQPFMVVDKRAARVAVFSARGELLGAAPALLGMAAGDVDVPGVGLKPVSQIKPAERITPAGRFATEPGRGLQGDAIVWFDYAAGLAIHRVRPGSAQAARTERLAERSGSSSSANSNANVSAKLNANADTQRISLGCVVLSPAFFEAVVQPSLGQQRGVIYVLPETRPLKTLLASLARPAPVLAAVR